MPEGIRGRPFEMSKFHCREMLYDYMSGRLDEQRRIAVEKALKEDKNLKAELDEYIDAAHYCEKLSQVQLSETTINDLASIRLQSEIVADKVRYRNWPDLLKWSSEAVVISVFVAGLAMVIPWSTIRSAFKNPPHNDVILADVEKAPTAAAMPVEELPAGAQIKPASPEIKTPVVTAPVPAPIPPDIVKIPPPPAKAIAPLEPPKPRLIEKPKEVAAVTKPAAQGMLHRILMSKADIEKLAPELRDKIIALGGKKAGEVEIGWRQTGQNYFHFSMPEENYDQLLSALAAIGPSRIYKSPHPRIMPEGIMRIILTIKDGTDATSPKVEEAFGETAPPEEDAGRSEESTPATEQ